MEFCTKTVGISGVEVTLLMCHVFRYIQFNPIAIAKRSNAGAPSRYKVMSFVYRYRTNVGIGSEIIHHVAAPDIPDNHDGERKISPYAGVLQ